MSWKGKILIPQIQYLLSSCYCPYSYLKKIDTLLFSFLWNNKISKIKRNSVCAIYSMCGLKMPDIFAINRTSEIKWLKKLFLLRESNKCRTLTWYLLNIKMSEFKNKLSVESKGKCLTLFHKQVFDSWLHFYSKPPYTVEDIWHEHLFENKYIC